MANVTIKVRLIKEISGITCEGTDAESCLSDIMDNDRLTDHSILDYVYDCMEVVESESTYDDPEPE